MLRALSLVVFVLVAGSVAHAVDITVCDQVVPPGQVGELRNDLDCSSGSFAAAVHLGQIYVGQMATLRLNGHRLKGPTVGGRVVDVPGSARIEGPGEIDSATAACIGVDGRSLFMDGGETGIDIHDCNSGISVEGGKASLKNVTVRDNVGVGAYAFTLKARSVTATGNLQGLNASTLNGVGVTASGNALFGVGGNSRVILHGATIDANGRFGIDALSGNVTVQNVVVTNSGEVGILALGKIVLKGSSVTGTGPGTGAFPPNTDLYSRYKKPTLVQSTCGRSEGLSGTWGVCTND